MRLGSVFVVLGDLPVCGVIGQVIEQILGYPYGLDVAEQRLVNIGQRQTRKESIYQGTSINSKS